MKTSTAANPGATTAGLVILFSAIASIAAVAFDRMSATGRCRSAWALLAEHGLARKLGMVGLVSGAKTPQAPPTAKSLAA
jgi:hypothetical protein